MKPVFLFVTLSLLALSPKVKAQHCQYDNSTLLAIAPYGNPGGPVIKRLRITLTDSLGKPYTFQTKVYSQSKRLYPEKGYNRVSSAVYDTAVFWRNPSPNRDTEHFDPDRKTRHFTFAGENYIFLTGSQGLNYRNYFVRIEDVDGPANGGEFETLVLPLKKVNFKHLCGYGSNYYETNDYTPLEAILSLKTPSVRTSYSRHFRFVLDTGLGDRSLRVFKLEEGKLIYALELIPGQSCNDSIQTGDFNFDGYCDFRICHSENNGTHQYFLYHTGSGTFIQDPLLGSMENVRFAEHSKTFYGQVITREGTTTTTDYYTWKNGNYTATERMVIKILPNGETLQEHYQLSNGKAILTNTRTIPSPE